MVTKYHRCCLMTFVLGSIQLRKKMFTEGTVWYNNLLFISVEIRKIKSILEVRQSVHTLNSFPFSKIIYYFQTIHLCCQQGPSTKDDDNLKGFGFIRAKKKTAGMRDHSITVRFFIKFVSRVDSPNIYWPTKWPKKQKM